MNNEHLSEQEIQDMALNPPVADTDTHTNGCVVCQTAVKDYRALFAAFRAQDAAVFDFDLATAVLSQLKPARPGFFKKHAVTVSLAIAGCLMIGVAYVLCSNWLLPLLAGYPAIFIWLIAITFIGIFIFQMLDTGSNYKKNMQALNNF